MQAARKRVWGYFGDILWNCLKYLHTAHAIEFSVFYSSPRDLTSAKIARGGVIPEGNILHASFGCVVFRGSAAIHIRTRTQGARKRVWGYFVERITILTHEVRDRI